MSLYSQQTALEHPFEPAEVPLTSPTSSPPPLPAPPPASESKPSEDLPTETDTWQETYVSQVSEWRAQSASARSKAELTRAREAAERRARGQPPESWDGLGEHITASIAAANETVSRSLSTSVASLGSLEHVEAHEAHEEGGERAVQHAKTEIGSPSHKWEHLSSSPTSSYPSMSFLEASAPQSPSHQPALLAPTTAPGPTQTHSHLKADHNPTNVRPSTLPSVMDSRVAPRTRLSLALSSLAINLLLPFINGVMLGFGEIFAKDVLVGWFGWKTRHGRTATGLGLRR